MRTPKKWILVASGAVALAPMAQAKFAPEERDAIFAFWNSPGRYEVTDDFRTNSPYLVRQTADGSRWQWNYDALRGIGKGAGKVTRAKSIDPAWEPWVKAKVAYDYALASQAALAANLKWKGIVPVAEDSMGDAGGTVTDPGPMPATLASYLPAPPPFAQCVVAKRYLVRFEDSTPALGGPDAVNLDPASIGLAPAASSPTSKGNGANYDFVDHVELRPRNSYFRFENGVRKAGLAVKNLDPAVLQDLSTRAGLTESESRVMRAVSMLEGGFESVNTYDTGFLSVGLIQFAAQSTGTGSLGAVLRRLRDDEPESFQKDFRRFGIDITDERQLVALDLRTGEEKVGPDAVATIIDDKRLTAVFQRAGERCDAYRLAQLKVAKEWYFPADDTVKFQVDGNNISMRVGDIVRSEAGLATLMEQKVHKGGYPSLGPTLTAVANEFRVLSPEQLVALEAVVVQRMKDRMDFLQDPTLSQPPPAEGSGLTSRHGTRQGRGRRKTGG
jgi:hypothetical protein